LPATGPRYNRQLFFFGGGSLQMVGHEIAAGQCVIWAAAADVKIRNGPEPVELLLLQGRPIGEHVAQHGPFVMNSRGELHQAFMDYQRRGFSGWNGRRAARYMPGRQGGLPNTQTAGLKIAAPARNEEP
jgi:redox-sensitive bicupin YhaK (pirin superfamily)